MRLPKRLQVIYSLIALVIIAGIATFIWAVSAGKITPFAAPGEAALSLQSDSSSYNPGVNFTVYINVDTGGTDISQVAIRYLNFNPAVLDVVDQDQNQDGVQIAPGSLGNLNSTENSVDTGAGKIVYVAQGGGFTGVGRVATVYFTAKASGSSSLNFDFSPSIGDTDVIATQSGNDILTSAMPMTITVTGNEAHTECSNQTCQTVSGAGANQCSNDTDCQPQSYHYECYAPKQACVKKSGAGTNQCVTYSDCLKPSPTPPGPSPEPSPVETATATPPIVSIETVIPTPSPEVASPTPTEFLSPSELPSPEISPETKVAGFGISTTWALILFIGIPVLITAIIFSIWRWRKKKKGEFEPSGNESDLDDDELI